VDDFLDIFLDVLRTLADYTIKGERGDVIEEQRGSKPFGDSLGQTTIMLGERAP
jgi:hypothetical protein